VRVWLRVHITGVCQHGQGRLAAGSHPSYQEFLGAKRVVGVESQDAADDAWNAKHEFQVIARGDLQKLRAQSPGLRFAVRQDNDRAVEEPHVEQ
jgi:hypothetical protein